MIVLLCLLLATLQPGDPVVRLSVEPLIAEVGQPVALTLELEVDSADALDEPFDFGSAFDDSWVVFDRRRSAPLRGGVDGRAVTRWTFELASLEPGTRSLTTALVEPLGFGAFLEGEAPALEIGSVLATDAMEPRPLVGFPANWRLDELVGSNPWLKWGIGIPLLLLCALGLWIALRRPKADSHVVPKRSLAVRANELQLDSLRGLDLGRLREQAFGVTALLREAVDGRRGALQPGIGQPGATDEEWLATVLSETKIDAATRDELSTLFEMTTRIKYRGERPSDFALDELGQRAKGLLDAELRLTPEAAA